jgi:hypothetical protein
MSAFFADVGKGGSPDADPVAPRLPAHLAKKSEERQVSNSYVQEILYKK